MRLSIQCARQWSATDSPTRSASAFTRPASNPTLCPSTFVAPVLPLDRSSSRHNRVSLLVAPQSLLPKTPRLPILRQPTSQARAALESCHSTSRTPRILAPGKWGSRPGPYFYWIRIFTVYRLIQHSFVRSFIVFFVLDVLLSTPAFALFYLSLLPSSVTAFPSTLRPPSRLWTQSTDLPAIRTPISTANIVSPGLSPPPPPTLSFPLVFPFSRSVLVPSALNLRINILSPGLVKNRR